MIWEIRMRAWGVLKNRAIAASLGAVLVFSIGAFAATQVTHHGAPAGQANTANTATDTATTGAAATATATTGSSSGSGGGANPTATTPPTATSILPTATPRPQPTPTNVPANQQIQIQGPVYSVSRSTNSFTVLVGSLLYTIVTNGNTRFSGVTGLSQIERGMDANVTGTGNPDGSGSLLASSVEAQDN